MTKNTTHSRPRAGGTTGNAVRKRDARACGGPEMGTGPLCRQRMLLARRLASSPLLAWPRREAKASRSKATTCGSVGVRTASICDATPVHHMAAATWIDASCAGRAGGYAAWWTPLTYHPLGVEVGVGKSLMAGHGADRRSGPDWGGDRRCRPGKRACRGDSRFADGGHAENIAGVKQERVSAQRGSSREGPKTGFPPELRVRWRPDNWGCTCWREDAYRRGYICGQMHDGRGRWGWI